MRYRTMPNEVYEFTTGSLGFTTVEEMVVRNYDLGSADSSNFMELPEGRSSSHIIQATKGIIEFSAIVNRQKDGKYYVICYPSSVKKEM